VTSTILVFFALLAGCVWVGGLVTLVVVARLARHQLEPAVQVAFFRSLGRAYAVVGGSALAAGLACGGALLARHGSDATAWAAVGVAAALVAVTAAGIVQARGMTRLRARAVRSPGDAALAARVRRGSRRAGALRASIAACSLALLALAAVLAA
jgi:hypothetical protein